MTLNLRSVTRRYDPHATARKAMTARLAYEIAEEAKIAAALKLAESERVMERHVQRAGNWWVCLER